MAGSGRGRSSTPVTRVIPGSSTTAPGPSGAARSTPASRTPSAGSCRGEQLTRNAMSATTRPCTRADHTGLTPRGVHAYQRSTA